MKKPVFYVNCTYSADELESLGRGPLLDILIECLVEVGVRAVSDELFG